MNFILCLSLLWVCFGLSAIEEQLSKLNQTHALQSIDNLPLLSTFNKEWNDEGVLVRDVVFVVEQMGNRLSWYFEALACCDIVGLHFVWPAPIQSVAEQDIKFLSAFPRILPHPSPSNATQASLVGAMKKTCPKLLVFPHEFDGAWSKRTPQIGAMMRDAIEAVYGDVRNVTIRKGSMEYLLPSNHKEEQLPLVPSAAILFRCVDILKNGFNLYGFVNFNVYTELIPVNATHIYILTEKIDYLNKGDAVIRKHCVDIGHHMVDFLHTHYPQAVIALRRGHAVDSVAMQANAEVVISAPSTFVLFPGIASTHKVYLMPGQVFKEQPFVRDQFFWITSPAMLYGASMAHPHEAGALQKYMAALTAPLSEKMVCVTHTDKKVLLP